MFLNVVLMGTTVLIIIRQRYCNRFKHLVKSFHSLLTYWPVQGEPRKNNDVYRALDKI